MVPENLWHHMLMSVFDQLTRTLLLTTTVLQKSFGTAHSQMRCKYQLAVLLKRHVYPTVYMSACTHLQPSLCTPHPSALPIPISPCYFSLLVP